MALPLLSKLLWGTVLIVGAGAGLSNSILSSMRIGKESYTSKTEIPSTNSKSQNKRSHFLKQSLESDSQNSASSKSNSEDSVTTTSPAPALIEKNGCVIHTLESSAGVTWKISEIGSLDKFLKDKTSSYVNRENIRTECDKSKGQDILLSNRSRAWYAPRQWDYFLEDQNHPQFRSYLNGRKK
ncbi:hypothetical protein MHC_02375 [Mycoplasma haemocanis str. Illinois]|uniref:Uncharacterized protein n=1 Tax=Mycoplasma haemocanis (strain Illinois) TaxID=1111676 RepID=H6N6R7_MYCHN|nr:hypothetical protein [Mycoplasma haemocanis]AEW45339.2 hypothetical protein MHC_02375 [Mycoplasma haemocanis str. Illinois]